MVFYPVSTVRKEKDLYMFWAARGHRPAVAGMGNGT